MYLDKSIVAVQNHPLCSPSKRYILMIDEVFSGNIKYFKFKILNNNIEIFDSEDLFDIRHNTYFLWDNLDNVWVYSGDVGTYVWEQKQSIWIKKHYSEVDSSPPDFLSNKYPKLFKK